MKGREVLQFIVDDFRNEIWPTIYEQVVIKVIINGQDRSSIQVRREEIEGIQKILNIADFIETITEEMMKQVLFGIKEKDFRK